MKKYLGHLPVRGETLLANSEDRAGILPRGHGVFDKDSCCSSGSGSGDVDLWSEVSLLSGCVDPRTD